MSFTDRDWQDRPVRTTVLGLAVGWFVGMIAIVLVLITVGILWASGVIFSSTYNKGQQIKENNQYTTTTHGLAYQQTLIDEERSYHLGWSTADNPGQKKVEALTFCGVYPELTVPPPDLVAADKQMCQ